MREPIFGRERPVCYALQRGLDMPFDIILDGEAEEFIQRMVESKRYADASDVVMHAIVLLEDQVRAAERRGAEFDAKIEEGLEDIRAGRVHDAEDVFREMEELIASKEARPAAAE